jgi:hypothetical protein
MATTRTAGRNARNDIADARRSVESPKEITHDVIAYMTEYAKQNPGYAVLACIGVGFVLGWKLKPW